MESFRPDSTGESANAGRLLRSISSDACGRSRAGPGLAPASHSHGWKPVRRGMAILAMRRGNSMNCPYNDWGLPRPQMKPNEARISLMCKDLGEYVGATAGITHARLPTPGFLASDSCFPDERSRNIIDNKGHAYLSQRKFHKGSNDWSRIPSFMEKYGNNPKGNGYTGEAGENHVAGRNVERNERRTELCAIYKLPVNPVRAIFERKGREKWEIPVAPRNVQRNEELGGICGLRGKRQLRFSRNSASSGIRGMAFHLPEIRPGRRPFPIPGCRSVFLTVTQPLQARIAILRNRPTFDFRPTTLNASDEQIRIPP